MNSLVNTHDSKQAHFKWQTQNPIGTYIASILSFIVFSLAVSVSGAQKGGKVITPPLEKHINLPKDGESYLTPQELLNLTHLKDPSLKSTESDIVSAYHETGVRAAPLYPSVNAQGINSAGFPGAIARGGEMNELQGLTISPFREGWAGNFTAYYTIWDFGRRIHRLSEAKRAYETSEQQYKVQRISVYQNALNNYFDCIGNRSLSSMYQWLAEQASVVESQVDMFVNTGQKSIVERYLSKSQTEEMKTLQANFNSRYEESKRHLEIIVRQPVSACPYLDFLSESSFDFLAYEDRNPILKRSESQLAEAKEKLEQEYSRFYPKLVGMATLGAMQGARLPNPVPGQLTANSSGYYAAAIGLVIPLFEGFMVIHSVDKAKATVISREYEINTTKQFIDETNARYQEIIESALVRLRHLKEEEETALKGFQVAKKRYFDFEGNLLDLREALNNLLRVNTELVNTRETYYLNIANRRVFNSGHIAFQ